MRSAGLVLFACAGFATGCIWRSDRPTVPQIVRALTPPVHLEGVILDHVLVEQPLGDSFLDRELWDYVLPVGQPETRALLAENGLRAGILSGTAPQKLQALLDSEADTVCPERLTFQLRKELAIPTAMPADPCRFTVLTDIAARPRVVELKQARCGICVRPEPSANGNVKIWCEPRVQHGTRKEWYRPNADGTQFIKEEEVSTESYAALGFEAVLGPEELLLIGWRADEPRTLGAMAFSAEANGRPRQRLLVIRAHRAKPDHAPDLPVIRDPFKLPSVAAQAAGKR